MVVMIRFMFMKHSSTMHRGLLDSPLYKFWREPGGPKMTILTIGTLLFRNGSAGQVAVLQFLMITCWSGIDEFDVKDICVSVGKLKIWSFFSFWIRSRRFENDNLFGRMAVSGTLTCRLTSLHQKCFWGLVAQSNDVFDVMEICFLVETFAILSLCSFWWGLGGRVVTISSVIN